MHDSERCADRYCMSPCCPSAAVGKTPSCTVMCQRHERIWAENKCHTWWQVYHVEDGVALWEYLKRLYQGLQSPGVIVTPCPRKPTTVLSSSRLIWLILYAVQSPQPHMPPPNATCNKCVAMQALEIENHKLRIALENAMENAKQSAAHHQSTVEDLCMKLALLQPTVPNVSQFSQQANAHPPTLNQDNLDIPPGSVTAHDDILMNQSGPAPDSGYASIPPVAACVSGDTNMYSYIHSGTGHEPTNAYSNQFEDSPMMFRGQGYAANDSINAPHMLNELADGEMFLMEMEGGSAAPTNTREMQLQKSSLSIPHHNQSPW